MSSSRRRFLGLAATVAITAGAGCSGVRAPVARQTSTPTAQNDGAGTAPPCPDGYTPLDPRWVVEGSGPIGGFELTVSSREVARSDTLTCKLRNVTDETQLSGIRSKLDVQYRDADGWRSIFGEPAAGLSWTDQGVTHPPGTGFTWRFPVTREGLSALDGEGGLRVCGPVEPGRYRFVYWGITTAKEATEDFETDYALGVPFTVVQK